MEILTFDFNNSFQNLKTFRQQANNTFNQLVSSTESAAKSMSDKFLSFAQDTTLASLGTSNGMRESFHAAYGALTKGLNSALDGMIKKTTAISTELGAEFPETWNSISQSTSALLTSLGEGFGTVWSRISQSAAQGVEALNTVFAAI